MTSTAVDDQHKPDPESITEGDTVRYNGDTGEVIAAFEHRGVAMVVIDAGGSMVPARAADCEQTDQRRENARRAIIYHAATNGSDGVYDAIAAGKIPGVRLDD